jgi:hypothetical protein
MHKQVGRRCRDERISTLATADRTVDHHANGEHRR